MCPYLMKPNWDRDECVNPANLCNKPMKLGMCAAPTDSQSVTASAAALKAAGAGRVFWEMASGAEADEL